MSIRNKSAYIIALASLMTTACNATKEEENGPYIAPNTDNPIPSVETSETTSPTSLIATPPKPQLPDHYYDERRGWTYYYIAAVSEDDQKSGRAVGNVSSFQYLGMNASGEHVLASLKPNGTVNYRAKCKKSCRIIDTDYGEKIAYSSGSIIGVAFQDAFRGKLRIADWAKDEVAKPLPAPSPKEPPSPVFNEPNIEDQPNVRKETPPSDSQLPANVDDNDTDSNSVQTN